MAKEDIFAELTKMPKGGKGSRAMMVFVVLMFAAFVAVLILNPFVKVNAGERGVLLRFGAVQPVVFDEGLHIVVPFMDQVIKMDVTVKKSETDARAASSDIQDTRSTIALNYHIDPENANIVYQKYRHEYKSRIIDPAVQEAVKAVTARYNATDLITKRAMVREDIKAMLKDRLAISNIIVDDFAIISFEFSAEFSKAIEAKQTAEQFAIKAENDLVRIEIEAKQTIERAKAEAESLRLQKQNISKDLIELRRIEAQMKAIEKWDGNLPNVTGGAMPFVDVQRVGK
jgi:regulator of protease activity HflC (stomatin/prohibitin superfamily)